MSESDCGARRERLSADAGSVPGPAVSALSGGPRQGAATGLPGISESDVVSGDEAVLAAPPDLGPLAKLKEKNLTVQGLIVIEGRIAIEKALDVGILPRVLVCTEAEADYWRAQREAICVRPEATGAAGSWFSIYAISHAELCALVDFKFHRGAIAVADLPKLAPFDGAGHREAHGGQYAPPREVFLCLWDVTDPSNLGALVRTAAALGLHGVLLGPGCASPYYRKTIRASMGNVFSIPLWSVNLGALQSLNRNGARIVAAALTEKALPLTDFDVSPREPRRQDPLLLVLGNEGYGLPTEVLNLCTDEVCIPMARGIDSLNVAVAGGILMYELMTSPKNAVRASLLRKE